MKTQKVLELCASHLADVVGGHVATHVVPLVISSDWEEWVMMLPECEAHLVVIVVVRFTIAPVEPDHHQSK